MPYTQLFRSPDLAAPTGKPAVVRRRLTASKTQRTPANPARRRSAFFTADKLILQEAARGPCVPEHWPIALNLQEGARVPCKLIQEQSALKSARRGIKRDLRSEEHTSELQSLMRISYAVFCLKKKT